MIEKLRDENLEEAKRTSGELVKAQLTADNFDEYFGDKGSGTINFSALSVFNERMRASRYQENISCVLIAAETLLTVM